MITVDTIWNDVGQIRSTSPLVHNITNYVVMNSTANALLSIGASPVMAHAIEEVEQMVGIAGALVVNIGTLSEKWIEAMLKAGKAAARKGIPVILDPVGAGATTFRTEAANEFIRLVKPKIIRGNASEIMALVQLGNTTKGVDSTHGAEAAVEAGRELAECINGVVSISGETDVILDQNSRIRINNGHPLMPKVTGLGCTATALTGAFAAVNPSPLLAAAHAMAVMGICGEIAAEKSQGPGSLQINFIDMLYTLNESMIQNYLRVEEK
jgi:hydroxyethylthiazole kinase